MLKIRVAGFAPLEQVFRFELVQKLRLCKVNELRRRSCVATSTCALELGKFKVEDVPIGA